MIECKQRIEISAEMVSFVGAGDMPVAGWPDDSPLITFCGLDGTRMPVLHFDPVPVNAAKANGADVALMVRREACRRLFGGTPPAAETWYMPSALRALAQSIRDCEAAETARPTLQGARSVDLLCQTFAEFAKGQLVSVEGDGQLSQLDARRIASARRMIDERWHEKLTLESIAKACGINRDKLARGFRATYNATVADTLSEKRLGGARKLLLATDLPVATVAYNCGYLNNASFTRAFSRRFGLAPTQLRHAAIAA